MSIWNCGVIVRISMLSEHGDLLEACNYDYDQRFKMLPSFSFVLYLEVWRERRVEGRGVVGRRVEENGYPPYCLDVFKIRREENN